MKVLVTGAAGFIGSHISDRLLAEGHTVVGVDNLLTGRADNFAGELHVEDICDRDVFYGIANKVQPELIIHCAASYSNPGYWHRDADTNVTGTINTTIAATHHGARLLYFQTALPPISSYAISKIAGEQYIALSGVDHTIFRLANMYGPRNLSGPIPTFYKRLTNGEPCTVVDTARDMVYVADLVEAVMATIESLYWAVANALGIEDEANLAAAGADDVKQMELDGSRARGLLGWQPTVGLRQGVEAAVGWYQEHGVDQTYTHLKVAG